MIKGYFLAGALALASILSAAGAGMLTHWREQAGQLQAQQQHTKALQLRDERIHALELALEKANAATDLAAAQTRAAEQAQKEASKQADQLARLSLQRASALLSGLGEMRDCSQVLARYWELRQ